MHRLPRDPGVSARSARLVAALALCSLIGPRVAQAVDPLGLYIGAAYGQAHIRAQLSGFTVSSDAPLGEFDATHSAYQAMLGIRALSFLGAEITYMDFGQRSFGPSPVYPAVPVPFGPGYPFGQQVSQKGEGAFALLYLPVPVIDVYVKAGMSRLTTHSVVTYRLIGELCPAGSPNCGTYSVSRSSTDTSFAYGAGLQWKLGRWAVRGEYERFSAAGENPSLLSLGMTYWIR